MKRQILSTIGLCLLTAGWATASFTDWTYKRPITLSTATTTNNYQVKVVLTTNTFNYAPCEAGGNDLRFEDSSTLLSLPYWIESWNSSGTSTVWVAVANSGTTTFTLYYGKSGAAAASSGTNTFDFFDDFSGTLAKWTKRAENVSISIDSGSVLLSTGTGASPYGWTCLATTYTNFANGIIEGKMYLTGSSIAELGFRGNWAANTGYKTRMEARTSNGICHLKPPYIVGQWNVFGNFTAVAVSTGKWLPFMAVANGVNFSTTCDGRTQANTDGSYAGPGEISLQNHYTGSVRFDDIRVRKYAATEPTATIGAEQLVVTGVPIVNNSIGATNIWADSAWLNGVLVSTGTSTTVWGVLWGTNNPGTTRDGWLGGNAADLGLATGNNLTNTTQATGLAENTTYYYAYWATNAIGTNVAGATSFTTRGGPSVDNGTGASGIGIGTATLNGNLLATGGLSSEVYVYWGPDTNNWANTNYLGSKSVGAFSVPVSNLYYGVRYYYRCYAVNAYAGRWAASSSEFLTLSPANLATWPIGWSTNAWTGDATSGISSDYTYPVKVNLGGTGAGAGAVTINGVTFGAHALSGANYSISGGAGTLATHDGKANNVADVSSSKALATPFLYGGNPMTVAITNLTVGKRYLTTFYAYAWDDAGSRFQTFAVAGGPSCTVDQDFYGLINGIRIAYAFDATATGNIFTITPAITSPITSFHISGLSVAQDPATKSALSVTNTGSSAAAPGAAIFNATVNATGSVFDVWAFWGPTDGTNNPNAWLGSTLVTTVTNATAANVSKTVAGLPPGTTFYTFRIINAATNFWATPSGSAVVEATADAPKIETRPETNVNTNQATLNGFLTSTGTSATVVSVYWGSDGDRILTGDWAFTNDFGVCTALPFEGLAYATNVTGLTAGQQYTYRYYAANATTGVWGDAVSFVTWLTPTVDNGGGATAISATNATLRGTVLTGNPNPQAWIYWGSTDGGTDKGVWNRTPLDRGVQAGLFSGDVSGLEANRTYYYRCYVSNDCGEAWALASASFTTLAPGVSINDTGVTEGAGSTTTSLVFTVSLSATSAVAVSVDYATSNGTATVADNDYTATSGTLTIPAGNLTGQIPVTVNGNDLYESSETLYVNLTTPVNATIVDNQGIGTITNDDFIIYVRGDGLGSDSNSGATWANAFATMQKALDTVPYFAANLVHVQASTGSQSYATCTRSLWAQPSTYRPFIVSFIGGWQNVDTVPVQSGMSRVKDPTASKPGFQLMGPYSYHSEPKTVLFDRFEFSNVTDGIQFFVSTATDNASVLLTVSNTVIHAENNGIMIDYNRPGYPTWNIQVYVRCSTITAGLSGSGEAVRMNGNHMPLDVDASSTLWSVGGANVVLSASTLVEMPARLAGTLGIPASGYDLVKYGAAYLRVSDPNTFSHKLGIYDGPLRGTAMSAGSPFGTAAVELNQSGGLRLDAVAGVSDTPMGKLNPHSGAPSLQVVGVSGGGTWTATDLQRDNRAVLTVLGSGGAALQTTDKFKIAAAPAVVNGMAAPYLVEASGDFLTYNAGGRGIERVASYTAGDINAAGAASVYSAPSAQTLTANREVYALKTGANISGANVDLTVGSGGVVVNGAATIDCNLQFNGQEGVIWNSATLAVNGAIKGTNGLTKAGVGTLTLNTNNTYAGVTTVNAGSLLLGVSDALPTNQPLALANVTFDLNGKNQTLGGLTIGAGALQNNSVAASTLGLSGTVVYNGVTGRANIAPPMGKTLSIVLGGATTFDVADGADYPDLRVGYYENYQDCPVAISGASAPVTKNGAGALHFRGANTFAGLVTVNRGVLSGEFFSAPLSPFGNTSNPMVLNGNGTVVCGNGGTWTFGPVSFSGGNALQFTAGSAPASWTIPSVTRAAGSRGTLVFAGNAFGGTYNDHLLANLSLFVTGWMSPDPNVNGMLPACFVLTPYLVNGFASHAVVNTGTGRTTPAGYDQTTFTGATATKKVDLAAAAALGADANIWALRTSYNVNVSAGNPTLTLGSGGLIANATCTISPSLKFGATGAAEGLVYVAPSQNATCGGQLLTTTGLTKFGGGVLSLNAASPSYAGDTWVHAGTLSLRDAQALGTGSEPIYLQYGATLEIGDPFTVNRPIVGAGRIGTGNGPFTLGPTGSLTPLTNTIATLSVEEMNFQGTYNWEYNESGADLIKVANLSFSGAPKVAVTWIGSGEAPKGTNAVFTYLGSDPAIDGLTARAPAGLQGRFQLDTANKKVNLVIETLVPRGTVILVF